MKETSGNKLNAQTKAKVAAQKAQLSAQGASFASSDQASSIDNLDYDNELDTAMTIQSDEMEQLKRVLDIKSLLRNNLDDFNKIYTRLITTKVFEFPLKILILIIKFVSSVHFKRYKLMHCQNLLKLLLPVIKADQFFLHLVEVS